MGFSGKRAKLVWAVFEVFAGGGRGVPGEWVVDAGAIQIVAAHGMAWFLGAGRSSGGYFAIELLFTQAVYLSAGAGFLAKVVTFVDSG